MSLNRINTGVDSLLTIEGVLRVILIESDGLLGFTGGLKARINKLIKSSFHYQSHTQKEKKWQ